MNLYRQCVASIPVDGADPSTDSVLLQQQQHINPLQVDTVQVWPD